MSLTASTLKVPKVEMLRRRGGREKLGKKFKMPFGQFCVRLFEMNETNLKSKKMHDGQLAEVIYREYSQYPTIAEKYISSCPEVKYHVARLRSTYNNGVISALYGPPKPELYSFAYNDKGDRINPRFKNNKILSQKEVDKSKDKARKLRDEWEKDQATGKI